MSGWTEHTALGDAGAESDAEGGVTASPDMLGSVGEEVCHPVTEEGSQSQCLQFVGQLVWIGGVEGRTVINEWHPDITVGLFQVCEGCVQCDGDGVISGSIGPVCKLVLVKVRRDAGLDMG